MDRNPLAPALSRLDAWDRLTSPERQRVASEVARYLLRTSSMECLEAHMLGGRTHEIAIFTPEGDRFALIPGDHATLGDDRSRPFRPTPEQAEDWERTEGEIAPGLYEIPEGEDLGGR